LGCFGGKQGKRGENGRFLNVRPLVNLSDTGRNHERKIAMIHVIEAKKGGTKPKKGGGKKGSAGKGGGGKSSE
jgi:hypothetical protein